MSFSVGIHHLERVIVIWRENMLFGGRIYIWRRDMSFGERICHLDGERIYI